MDNDDAQRRLEQQALRNVRGLVDKLERAEEPVSRSFVHGIVAAAVFAGLVVGVFEFLKWSRGGARVEVKSLTPVAPGKYEGPVTPPVNEVDKQRMREAAK